MSTAVRVFTATIAVALTLAALDPALAKGRKRHHPAGASRASEVQIGQAGGKGARVRSDDGRLKTAPEGASAPVPGATAPITCNAQNASSPACYTATRQSAPPR